MTDNTVGDSSNEIFTIDIGGSNSQQITNNTWSDWFPTYSACGDLMYVSQKVGCVVLSFIFSFLLFLSNFKVPSCDDDMYSIPSSALSSPDPEASAARLLINMCQEISDADPYGSKVCLVSDFQI